MSIQGTDIDITEPSNAKILKAYSDGGKPALFSENFEYFDAHDEIIKIYSQFKVAPDVYRAVLSEKIDQLYEELIKDKPVNFDSLDTLEQKATVNVDSKLKNFNEKKLPPGYPFKNKEISPAQMAVIMERLEKIKATCSGVVKSNLKDHEVIANCLRSPNPLNAFLMRDTSGDDEALLQRAFQAIVKNSDLNKKDENGKTPLEVALLNGNTKYALKLIEAGADIKQIDFNQENLQGKKLSEVVVLKGPKELMEKMLEAGVKLTLVDELALMNDLYLSRALSKEARVLISDDEQYLAFCQKVANRRYELFSEKQKGATHKEAAFNQLVRNTNFAPRSLLEAYMAQKLEETDKEEGSKYQGKVKIEVLLELTRKVRDNPKDNEAIDELTKMIEKYYPEEILETILPTYNDYLKNENEDNFLNTAQKKAKEEGNTKLPDEAPDVKQKRRAGDFSGQLMFMIESNIMAKSKDSAELTEIAKVFIRVRAKKSEGLTDRLEKVREEKGTDYKPPVLDSTDKGPVAIVQKNMNQIQNTAILNEIKDKAVKENVTLSDLKQRSAQKNQEFKLQNVVEMNINFVVIQVCEAIEKGEILIKDNPSDVEKEIKRIIVNRAKMSPDDFQKAVNNVIDLKLKERIPNYLKLAIENRDKVAIEKALKGFSKPQNFSELNSLSHQVEELKTTNYKRGYGTAVLDTFKTLGENIRKFKWSNPFKKPERTFKEILALGSSGNNDIKELLETTKKYSDTTYDEDSKIKRQIENEIEKLDTLSENTYLKEPTLAQKWAANLYKELKTNNNLDPKSQQALIEAIKVLQKNPNYEPKDNNSDFVYSIKIELDQILTTLDEDNNKIAFDLIREIVSGHEPKPDLLSTLQQSFLVEPKEQQEQQEQQEQTDVHDKPKYWGHGVDSLSDLRERFADKWIHELRNYSNKNGIDLNEHDRGLITEMTSTLAGIDKCSTTSELVEKMRRDMGNYINDNNASISPKVLQMINEVCENVKKGVAPEQQGSKEEKKKERRSFSN